MADQRRGPWSQHEDRYLMSLVESQGALNWVKISQMLGSRTPKQCRERYHQNLKPSLNHEPITAEEGALIEQLVHQLGKRWAEIARRLHNRSDNAVKNWWNGSQNRRKRLMRRRATVYDEVTDTSPFPRAPTRLQLPNISTSYSHYSSLSSPTSATGHYSHTGWHSGLPSPTTISPATDSLGDGAPSLMSDSGSYYSLSPTTSGPPDSPRVELPPLRLESAPSPRGYTLEGAPKLSSSQFSLPPIREALDGRNQLLTAPNSPVSYSTPRTQCSTPRGSLSREVVYDKVDKDSRMRLNNLLI
ncbi:Homeodomain-like protein [Xylariales sp. PMI_506]|nr:Homeodomain-like protein [Xylariales sp. PMI_506]